MALSAKNFWDTQRVSPLAKYKKSPQIADAATLYCAHESLVIQSLKRFEKEIDDYPDKSGTGMFPSLEDLLGEILSSQLPSGIGFWYGPHLCTITHFKGNKEMFSAAVNIARDQFHLVDPHGVTTYRVVSEPEKVTFLGLPDLSWAMHHNHYQIISKFYALARAWANNKEPINRTILSTLYSKGYPNSDAMEIEIRKMYRKEGLWEDKYD